MHRKTAHLKKSIALSATLAFLLLTTASVADAKSGPGVHNALRGPGAVVDQQPQTWQSDGFGWSSVFGVGVLVVVMALALGFAYASTRSTKATTATRSTSTRTGQRGSSPQPATRG